MVERASGLRGAERHAPAAPYLVLIKNNSDGNRMKSRSAFEFTVRKMLRQNRKLYFWTFTLREVHSLTEAMRLWNQFLTLLKRKMQFRGVRVLELHEEHGCHFHVITNQRFRIEEILALGRRYGFGPDECETGHGCSSGGKLSLQISLETAGAVFEESTAVVGIWED